MGTHSQDVLCLSRFCASMMRGPQAVVGLCPSYEVSLPFVADFAQVCEVSGLFGDLCP